MSSCCGKDAAGGRGCPREQGIEGPASGCGARRHPGELTPAERRAWLEAYKRHLEERLAEVERQLASDA